MAERTVSATEARVHFGELLNTVADGGEPVIVERGGQPLAVVISLAEWRQLQRRRDDRWANAMTALEDHWAYLSDRYGDSLDGIDIERSVPVGKSGPTRSTTHCVDAGIVVRAVVTTGHPAVRQLWRDFRSTGADLVAPPLLRYEVTNVIHRLRHAGILDAEAAARSLAGVLALPIDCYDELDLHGRAAELAADFGLPAAYDSHYLALAERLGVDFWTTDRTLAKAVCDQLPWVRLVA